MTGLIRLAGTDARREGWFFRPQVEGIPVGGSFERLYLLHSTYFNADLETTIARIRLNYADGSAAEIPIQYGTHVLNFWRQRYESASNLSDPESRVAWMGDAPALAAYGNSMRLCVSSLWNPHPEKPVQTLDVVSSGSTASEVIVGMSVGGPDLPVEWRDTPIVRVPEVPWDGRLRFRAVDQETGEAIAGMRLRLEVAEPGAHCRIASYETGADGWVEVRYPKAPLDYITLWANHDAYVPRIVQWTRRQHGEFPDEYVYRAEPGLTIQGRIVDDQERPVSGALVRIEGPRQDFAGEAKEFLMLTQILTLSDDSGRWSSRVIPRELPAEFIRVEVLHPGFPTRSYHVVTAAEKRGAEIRILMSAGMSLQGRVVDARNLPVSGAVVRLGNTIAGGNVSMTSGAVARTDSSGAFTLRSAAAPSTRVLGVEAEGFAPLVVPVPDDLEGVMQAPVVLYPGHSVRIEVRDLAGGPIPGVLLTGSIMSSGWPLSTRLTTDEAGRAVWAHAPSLGWLVEASIEGFGRSGIAVMPGTEDVVLQLTRTRELTGTVHDKTTALPVPLFRVWVGSMPFDSDEIEWEPQPMAMGREGQFRVLARFERLGTYYRFDAPGYRLSEAWTAAMLSARTTPIELEPLRTP
ncbi:MAG: carboxypeptidase-like regulatory domain-containing protein [Limisphaerales bacterium]